MTRWTLGRGSDRPPGALCRPSPCCFVRRNPPEWRSLAVGTTSGMLPTTTNHFPGVISSTDARATRSPPFLAGYQVTRRKLAVSGCSSWRGVLPRSTPEDSSTESTEIRRKARRGRSGTERSCEPGTEDLKVARGQVWCVTHHKPRAAYPDEANGLNRRGCKGRRDAPQGCPVEVSRAVAPRGTTQLPLWNLVDRAGKRRTLNHGLQQYGRYCVLVP